MDGQTDFPQCADGDVLILLTPMTTYKLHSQVLSRASTFFAEALSQPPAPLNSKARREGAPSYHFELASALGSRDSSMHLQQRELAENGRPKCSQFTTPSQVFDSMMATPAHLHHWDLLLGCFYNVPIKFHDDNMAVLLEDCSGHLDVAESVGATQRVREVIDLSLMRQDRTLWKSIAAAPAAWVGLGHRLQSPAIFREAVVHLAGNWQNIDKHQEEALDEDVRTVIERKAEYIEQFKFAVEMRIVGHYPSQCRRAADAKPGRNSYSQDIYQWMTSSFFRHWFIQAVVADKTRRSPTDGGHAFYMDIWKGGDRYLTHDEFRQFYAYFPMSRKACTVLENAMLDLKNEVKGFVKDLVVNRTHIPARELRYLTCTTLGKEDFPWEVKEEVKQEINEPMAQFAVTESDDEDDAVAAPVPPAGRKRKRAPTGSGGVRKRVAKVEPDTDGEVPAAATAAAAAVDTPTTSGPTEDTADAATGPVETEPVAAPATTPVTKPKAAKGRARAATAASKAPKAIPKKPTAVKGKGRAKTVAPEAAKGKGRAKTVAPEPSTSTSTNITNTTDTTDPPATGTKRKRAYPIKPTKEPSGVASSSTTKKVTAPSAPRAKTVAPKPAVTKRGARAKTAVPKPAAAVQESVSVVVVSERVKTPTPSPITDAGDGEGMRVVDEVDVPVRVGTPAASVVTDAGEGRVEEIRVDEVQRRVKGLWPAVGENVDSEDGEDEDPMVLEA